MVGFSLQSRRLPLPQHLRAAGGDAGDTRMSKEQRSLLHGDAGDRRADRGPQRNVRGIAA